MNPRCQTLSEVSAARSEVPAIVFNCVLIQTREGLNGAVSFRASSPR